MKIGGIANDFTGASDIALSLAEALSQSLAACDWLRAQGAEQIILMSAKPLIVQTKAISARSRCAGHTPGCGASDCLPRLPRKQAQTQSATPCWTKRYM